MIYHLKRQYGVKVDVYRSSGETIDFETGIMGETLFKYSIKRAIVLPNKKIFDTNRGSYIFTGSRDVVIDPKDLSINIDQNDYLFINNVRYEIDNITDTSKGLILTVTSIKGVINYEIHDESIKHTIGINDDVQ